MIESIKRLEKIARRLEPSPEQREHARASVLNYTENFLDHIYTLPAYVQSDEKGKGIYDSPISEQTVDIAAAIELFRKNVDSQGLNPASGGHLGYIPGGGIYYSALGDYLADVTNRFAGIYFASPGAVRMENMLIQWMSDAIGYPAEAGGNLTSGGSIANLMGIVTARDAHDLKAKEYEKSVIYLTSQAHHSIDKAIRIAGLRECVVRHIPVDERFRMDADAFEQAVVADKKAGLNPFLLIASAGTTDAGAVDPLHRLGEICKHHHLWFHADGAYGAFFVLCEEGKKILRGIESSDSAVMDPHKGLFLPYGTGAVLIRDKKKLFNSYWYQANYLQDAATTEELSPADLSPELTKHYRGLRMWLPLKLLGVTPFKAAIEEKLLLARYFHEEIQKIDGFEVGPYPDLSVVTYRYVPKKGDANKFNEQLVKEIHKDGRVFISSTVLNGNFTLRVAILCFRTHLDTIDLALKVLKEKARMIEKG
ncbi:MAG TPA: aminotransferase class I/II-fold pyridoxal phosphate-dependent enzyme [Bacteroidota bacterium]|nr:aminotransferase class I/II-fold pyridoxal phosphate-dependent enzyme [Bacteroidota bacterium]